jgi:hypothetical protein
MGSGESTSTSTGTAGITNEGSMTEGTTTEMPTTTIPTMVQGGSGTTTTPQITTNRHNFPCVFPFCNFPPHVPPPQVPPPPVAPPPPRVIPVPIFVHKEVVVIVTPPKPVPQIPVCQGKIKEICCDSKDFCPWNWWYYPAKSPPKVCKVEVEVVKELELCQYPVLVWKDEFDFTCKCPPTPKPCQSCNTCFQQGAGSSSSSSASASADASASSGYAG